MQSQWINEADAGWNAEPVIHAGEAMGAVLHLYGPVGVTVVVLVVVVGRGLCYLNYTDWGYLC